MFWFIVGFFIFLLIIGSSGSSSGSSSSSGSIKRRSNRDVEEISKKIKEDVENKITNNKNKEEISNKSIEYKENSPKIDEKEAFSNETNDLFNNLQQNLVNTSRRTFKTSNILYHAATNKIDFLCHFTDFDNLYSIMTHGLLSVHEANVKGVELINNDNYRLDGRMNGISLSVSFPNSKMFYKYRVSGKKDWVVILYDKKILKEKDCAFFKFNAADHRMRNIPIEELKTVSAFYSMFSRANEDEELPENFTTDEQAEVMVFERIQNSYIKKIVFNNRERMKEFINRYGNQIPFEIDLNEGNTGYFASRRYRINEGRKLWH